MQVNHAYIRKINSCVGASWRAGISNITKNFPIFNSGSTDGLLKEMEKVGSFMWPKSVSVKFGILKVHLHCKKA